MRVSVASPGGGERFQAAGSVPRLADCLDCTKEPLSSHPPLGDIASTPSTFHVLAHTLVSHWICILYVEYVARVGQHHAAHAQPPSFNTALALTGWTVLCIL